MLLLALLACAPDPTDTDKPGSGDSGDSGEPDTACGTEVCNGLDDDCDGAVDEDPADGAVLYADADGDGYGDVATATTACGGLEHHVTDATDCDDADGAVHPGAVEVCEDGRDNDCEGTDDVCVPEGPVSLASADVRLLGAYRSGDVGSAVAGAGDLDGDGHADLLVGALLEDSASDASGTLYVVSGGGLPRGDTLITTVSAQIQGDSAPTGVGYDLSGNVDVDRDGTPDAMVVATFNGSNGISTAYLFLDPDPAVGGVRSVADNDARVTCATTIYSMSAALSDDADGDGEPDLLVGCGGESTAYLFHGVPSGDLGPDDADLTLTRGLPTYYLGASVRIVGDVDGDGIEDLYVGGRYLDDDTYAGTAWLVAAGGLRGRYAVADVGAALVGTPGDEAGRFVEGVGDADGDGYADLLVGAGGASNAAERGGAAYLVQGNPSATTSDLDLSTVGTTFVSSESRAHAGYGVGAAGDMNGDGWLDVAIGAPLAEGGGTARGEIYVVGGPFSAGQVDLADADLILQGAEDADYAGWAIASAGDLDADGRDDLVIGVQYAQPGAEGAAYVVFGRGF